MKNRTSECFANITKAFVLFWMLAKRTRNPHGANVDTYLIRTLLFIEPHDFSHSTLGVIDLYEVAGMIEPDKLSRR